MTKVKITEKAKFNVYDLFTMDGILSTFSVVGTFLILARIINYSNFGLDFTDESFYLVWISNPFIYDASVTQFGFLYHPIYLMLGGDISNLRQANVLMVFCLAWCLVFVFLKSMVPEVAIRNITLTIAAAGVATVSLTAFDSWLLTPSYNSLAFKALLIASIGLLLCDKNITSRSALGWILLGVGGWLAFMAKPSTALALAIGALTYLIFARKFSFRMLLLAVASALVLLLISALLIDGSLYKFANRLRTGLQLASYLGGGHSFEKIIRLDSFQLGIKEKILIIFLTVIIYISTRLACSEIILGKFFSIFVSALFFGFIVSFSLGMISGSVGFSQFQGIVIFGAIFPAIALGLMLNSKKFFNSIFAEQWAIAILFFAMPHIYAFGTNRNYWVNGGSVCIFWLLGGLVFLSPLARLNKGWGFVLPLVLATQAIASILLQTGLEQPQRQPQPLRLNDQTIEVGMSDSNLVLSVSYAKYIEDAKRVARGAGFKMGTPVIDLTGQSPGILYALRAENIGQAWTVGGYSGSSKIASAALNNVPCEKISNAWILYEPDGPRSIPVEVMLSQGADFPADYTQVGSWLTAEGAGGYSASRVQILYVPKAQKEILKACQALSRGADS